LRTNEDSREGVEASKRRRKRKRRRRKRKRKRKRKRRRECGTPLGVALNDPAKSQRLRHQETLL